MIHTQLTSCHIKQIFLEATFIIIYTQKRDETTEPIDVIFSTT